MMRAPIQWTAISQMGDQQETAAHRDQVLDQGQEQIGDGQAESAAVGITGESANDPAQST
jgi:hypothetical protein